MTSCANIPVITIDGPTASGKGTVAEGVARALGWHMLDSGALYRLTALATARQHIDPEDVAAVAQAAKQLDVRFAQGRVWWRDDDVTQAIRAEEIGALASRIAAYQPVREALFERQRGFALPPGLVADGRDMGTVIFPHASLKIFLEADPVARAERRYKQLKAKGISANISDLAQEMRLRDQRDRSRANAPLIAAADAYTIDSSGLTAEETIEKVLGLWASSCGEPGLLP